MLLYSVLERLLHVLLVGALCHEDDLHMLMHLVQRERHGGHDVGDGRVEEGDDVAAHLVLTYAAAVRGGVEHVHHADDSVEGQQLFLDQAQRCQVQLRHRALGDAAGVDVHQAGEGDVRPLEVLVAVVAEGNDEVGAVHAAGRRLQAQPRLRGEGVARHVC